MRNLNEAGRAVVSLLVGLIAAPVYLIIATIIAAILYAVVYVLNALGIYEFERVWVNYLNVGNISIYLLGLGSLASYRFQRTAEAHAQEVIEEDQYLVTSLLVTGAFIGYLPWFLECRNLTGHTGSFFTEDLSRWTAVLFGYDQILKGLMFDFFEFFKVELLNVDYKTGLNFETALTFVTRVLAVPISIYMVYLHMQAMDAQSSLDSAEPVS